MKTKKHNDSSTKLLEEKVIEQIGNTDKSSVKVRKSHNNENSKHKGPVFLICYVCGKEFGKHSLEIHLEKCVERHYQELLNKGTPKKEIKTPNPPEELLDIFKKIKVKEEPTYQEIQEYNVIGSKLFTEIIMKDCKNCGRKFNIDRLDVHLKSCNPKQLEKSNKQGGNIQSKPRMLMCPLCGKEFGSLSLDIHIKTCTMKFEREQELLPLKQRKSANSILEKY
mmetsp:Transcript_7189/g.6299  ORF Transcript_7189/g.6299 Transcript_7189/m.6299 type:complete len:223 (-) Transcript_7189:247-915(-)